MGKAKESAKDKKQTLEVINISQETLTANNTLSANVPGQIPDNDSLHIIEVEDDCASVELKRKKKGKEKPDLNPMKISMQ